jgi:Tfp pilus assembly protein PilN
VRPVNLIPPEERRGRAATGSRHMAAYAVIGVLALVLVAVVAITIFDNKASDSQAKLNSLQSEVDSAQAQASSFSSFTSFQQVHDERLATIDSLAKSRFDWERIMRELSIVLPDNVFLTNLTGTVSPDASVTNGAGLSLRGSIPGPALELIGCAQNQRTVARLIASMHDIDGVGRVLVSTSSKATPTVGSSGSSGAATGGASGCGSRPDFPTFQLVAALDGVPTAEVPATSSTAVPTSATATTGATTTPATGTATTPATGTTTTPVPGTTPAPAAGTATTPTTTTPSTDGGVADASATSAQQQTEVAAAQQQANSAAQIPTGGGK